jgi:hypothetical protein
MNRYWIHYWTQDTLESDPPNRHGDWLGHTSGDQFSKVRVGDYVYCFSSLEGRAILIARMQVDDIVLDQAEADRRLHHLGGAWPGAYHLFASREHATTMLLDRFLPLEVLQQLTFRTKGGGITRLKLRGDRLDPQTLRRVRELTSCSAQLLDEIIDRDEALVVRLPEVHKLVFRPIPAGC